MPELNNQQASKSYKRVTFTLPKDGMATHLELSALKFAQDGLPSQGKVLDSSDLRKVMIFDSADQQSPEVLQLMKAIKIPAK